MDIEQIIENAFPGSKKLAEEMDADIRLNADLMWLPGSPDYFKLVSVYVQWCIQNKENYDQLVTEWTINALAEFGRAKPTAPAHLNFKFLCSNMQRQAICAFLEWCLAGSVTVHDIQVQRAVKHWR